MLEAMRQLALDALWVELDGGKSPDPETWYQCLRVNDLGRLFPKLVEDVEQDGGKDKPRYYTLTADSNAPDVAILEGKELKADDVRKLPFNQPSGSQSPALGPIIKRSAPTKSKEAGPSVKIQQTTLEAFDEIGQSGKLWSSYFNKAWKCFLRQRLNFEGKIIDAPSGVFRAAINVVNEKRTVLLAFQDDQGRLPGEVPEYVAYLQEVLAQTKYATGQIPAVSEKVCSLCGRHPVTVYPNALRGAGINLANLDRNGAFSNLDPSAAWKGFSLCVGCADLLYVYWNHVAADFQATIAGYLALVIPLMQTHVESRKRFLERLRKWVQGIEKNQINIPEKQLLYLLSDEQKAVATVTILWAEFGQRIDDIRGMVTDILPSRLQLITRANEAFKKIASPVFPDVTLDEFAYDLSLSVLRPLLRRPGGKKAQARNDSRRLFDLRRDVAEAIYQGIAPDQFNSTVLLRLEAELHDTARWHWDEVLTSDSPWGLLYEGWSEKKKTSFLTAAGWVRQVARFWFYLKQIGVMRMPDPAKLQKTECEALKPYFGPDTAIDEPPKKFAFILGALYGKLLQVQAARGVNVQSNALTWLKRLTLAGHDLPELYIKIREKLMIYETEGNPVVRELVTELGELGAKLGTNIKLDETQTCYFLLLGQSLATKIMPRKAGETTEGEAHE